MNKERMILTSLPSARVCGGTPLGKASLIPASCWLQRCARVVAPCSFRMNPIYCLCSQPIVVFHQKWLHLPTVWLFEVSCPFRQKRLHLSTVWLSRQRCWTAFFNLSAKSCKFSSLGSGLSMSSPVALFHGIHQVPSTSPMNCIALLQIDLTLSSWLLI